MQNALIKNSIFGLVLIIMLILVLFIGYNIKFGHTFFNYYGKVVDKDFLLNKVITLKGINPDSSLYYAEELYQIAFNENNKYLIAESLYWQAWCKIQKSFYNQDGEVALADALYSLDKFTELKNEYGIVKSLDLVASCYIFLNKIDSSKIYIDKGLRELDNIYSSDSLDNYYLGELYNTLGLIYYIDKKFDSAYVYYNYSDSIFNLLNHSEGVAKVNHNKGVLYSEENFMEKALVSFQNSLKIYKDLGWNYGIASTQRNLGLHKVKMFKKYKVDKYLEDAITHLKYSLNHDDLNSCFTYNILAYAYSEKARNLVGLNQDKEKYDEYYIKSYHTYKRSIEASRRGKNSDCLTEELKNNVVKLCLYLNNCDSIIPGLINTTQSINQISKEEIKNESLRIRKLEINELIKKNRLQIFNVLWKSSLLILSLLILIVFFYQSREIKQARKQLQIKSQQLRAQMNPHFISNCLNSIESLVNLDKKKEASKYLVQFSRLCRMILTNSTSNDISLSEEIQGLTHYLSLAKLQFEDKLEYHIDIASAISLDSTRIPPLLLQPFVENAIEHGIKNKPTSGTVTVRIFKETDLVGKEELVCEVEDDGVGRAKAREIKEKSVMKDLNKQKSMGISITEERIQMIGNMKEAEFYIEDLTNETGEIAGTRVTIRLPLNYLKT